MAGYNSKTGKRLKGVDTKRKRVRRKKRTKFGVITKNLGLGIPDRMMVKLPYTFNYQVNATSPGSLTQGGTILACFAGNSYPNVAGGGAGVSNIIECPSQFFNYSVVYGRACITGALIDCTVAYDAAFGPTVTPNSPISNVLFTAATVSSTVAPYDADNASVALPDDSGSFFWNGVASGFPRPSSFVSINGNWARLQSLNIEELMSTPDTKIKHLTSPFGSKTMARFKQYVSTSRMTGTKDIMDNDHLTFSPPQNPTSALDGESFPQKGFGWMIKGFAPNLATGAGTGVNWQVSGRITYYITFYQKLSAIQNDWVPT